MLLLLGWRGIMKNVTDRVFELNFSAGLTFKVITGVAVRVMAIFFIVSMVVYLLELDKVFS